MCALLVIGAIGGMPTRNESKVRQKTKGDKGHGQTPATRSMPEDSTRVSFVLVWLSPTTLSLVTAPLVEPRYFIIPWLVWRMNIPVESREEDSHDESKAKHKGVVSHTF